MFLIEKAVNCKNLILILYKLIFSQFEILTRFVDRENLIPGFLIFLYLLVAVVVVVTDVDRQPDVVAAALSNTFVA